MKLQYLGDSKDSFKWDYHDFLANELGYPLLKIALMMTPDDGSSEGSSRPSLFPARSEIIEFCNELRETKNVEFIKRLPNRTQSSYSVDLHKRGQFFTNATRDVYFDGLEENRRQLLFLDPDNGLEPEKSLNEKHVSYSDVQKILNQLSGDSVVSVFHHFRRRSFVEDFARIKDRMLEGYATAIYWHFLMFVQMASSESAIRKVSEANAKYAEEKPVECIV